MQKPISAKDDLPVGAMLLLSLVIALSGSQAVSAQSTETAVPDPPAATETVKTAGNVEPDAEPQGLILPVAFSKPVPELESTICGRWNHTCNRSSRH